MAKAKTKKKKTEEELTDQEKEQKKLSPDSVDDQETKEQEYEDPEFMQLVADVIDEDEDGEIADDDSAKETEKKARVETEPEETEEEEPEEVEEEQEDEDEGIETKKKVEKKEEPVKVELSETAQNGLKPFKGNLSQQIEALVKSKNEAVAKLQSYGTVQNFVDTHFKDMKPNEISGTIKELQEAATLINNPIALDSMEAVLTGNIPDALRGDEKTVQDFMPEYEEYDYEDAMKDRNSLSWKAREKWERSRAQKQRQIGEFLKTITDKKESISNLQEQYSKAQKIITDNLEEVKTFAVDEYGADENVFNDFVKEFKSFNVDFIKVAFAVFAKQQGLESKAMEKIKKQKGKSFAETEISKSVEEREAKLEPTDKDKDKEFADTFSDWNNEESIYN